MTLMPDIDLTDIPETLHLGLGPAMIPMRLTKDQRRQLADAKDRTAMDLTELSLITKEVLIIEQPPRKSRNRSTTE